MSWIYFCCNFHRLPMISVCLTLSMAQLSPSIFYILTHMVTFVDQLQSKLLNAKEDSVHMRLMLQDHHVILALIL